MSKECDTLNHTIFHSWPLLLFSLLMPSLPILDMVKKRWVFWLILSWFRLCRRGFGRSGWFGGSGWFGRRGWFGGSGWFGWSGWFWWSGWAEKAAVVTIKLGGIGYFLGSHRVGCEESIGSEIAVDFAISEILKARIRKRRLMEEPSALLHNTDGCCRRDLLTGDFIKIGEREGATQELCVVVNCNDIHGMGWLPIPKLSFFMMAVQKATHNPNHWDIFIVAIQKFEVFPTSAKLLSLNNEGWAAHVQS